MKKILPILIIALVVFSGCLKRKESFLVGKWEDVPRVAESSVLNVWAFKDNNTFEIQMFPYLEDGTIGDVYEVLTGEYTVKKKNVNEFRLILELEDDNNTYIYNGAGVRVSGEYWIEELDRDILKMTREKWEYESHPFLRIEMIRL
jgi:hypothetical protein